MDQLEKSPINLSHRKVALPRLLRAGNRTKKLIKINKDEDVKCVCRIMPPRHATLSNADTRFKSPACLPLNIKQVPEVGGR